MADRLYRIKYFVACEALSCLTYTNPTSSLDLVPDPSYANCVVHTHSALPHYLQP